MSLLSRYSYVYVSIALVAAFVWYAIWSGSRAFGITALLVATLLLVFWVAARRQAPMPANPLKRIRRARESTRPVVVHFYSDYSVGCLLKRVLAARAERGFRGRFDFIYIDMTHPEGDGVADSLGASLGQFVLFDATGELVERSGMIGRPRLEAVLERPAK